MANEKDNTVSSKDQLTKEESIFGKSGNGKKILFLGNSITRHGEAAAIGWLGNWGMAASSEEKDYVHQTLRMVWEKSPEASFLVAQISMWEREWWDENVILDNYSEAINYGADIIIMRAIENVAELEHDGMSFVDGYKRMLKIMAKDGATVVLTSPFWISPDKNDAVKRVAEEENYPLVDVCIGSDDRYTAAGKFEHAGVAAHPGDEGMLEIAKRIYAEIEKYL